MISKLQELETIINTTHAQALTLEAMQEDTLKRKEQALQLAEDAKLARELVIDVATKTQMTIANRISSIVSLALAAVWDDPYTFVVEFVNRRGTTEADLFFERDGNRLHPLQASGGGVVDIASFALRIAIWSLKKQTRPIFILDEPFRNLSADKHEKAGLMVQELSKTLGIQIIMVSHNPDIISGADKVFHVSQGEIKDE